MPKQQLEWQFISAHLLQYDYTVLCYTQHIVCVCVYTTYTIQYIVYYYIVYYQNPCRDSILGALAT